MNVFKETFKGRFWQKLKESLVEFDDGEIPSSKARDTFLTNLYSEINIKKYLPSTPREYIVFDKHNLVSRIVPTFTIKDYCVYFYCISQLEDHIADREDRVPGTFGGWRLHNSLSEAEEEEVSENENLYMADADSDAVSAYNPLAWRKHWKDFQNRAYDVSKEFSRYGNFYCIKFDVANFYDCINLSRLKRQIQICCDDNELSDEIDLLFLLLENWNRKFEGYMQKTVGIPQDEVQDCSRILANFYIRDYDKFMYQMCSDNNSRYLRYADDQMIIAQNEITAKKILYEASKKLHSIGLNINASKVEIFEEIDKYEKYWSFDIYELLPDENLSNTQKIDEALEIYFDRKNDRTKFREYSIINRLLMCKPDGVNLTLRLRFYSDVLDKKFLAQCSYHYLKRIYYNLEISQRVQYLAALDNISKTINYNSFLYALLKFYKLIDRAEGVSEIKSRIETIKI